MGLAFINADGNCAFTWMGYAASPTYTITAGRQLRPLLTKFIVAFWRCEVPGGAFPWSAVCDYPNPETYYEAMIDKAYGGVAEFRAWATLIGCELRLFYDSD